MDKINVTKTFLPPADEYQRYVDQIWQNGQLTNQGPLLHELESNLNSYLGSDYLHFVANGTLALQLALSALDITEGEVITSPFSYVATVSAIMWEKCQPVFVDIEPGSFCIDATKIEAAITPRTKAIMPVHVFGYPCDVEKIEAIAKKHNLKVIYDGAHAFGVTYKGKPLLNHGDISTCSFHATKLFHTIEGGAVITGDKQVSEKLELMKRFGHQGDEHYLLGINAKASEFQAAMGLCNLNYIDELISQRREIAAYYDQNLSDNVVRPPKPKYTAYNHGYYPVVFENEATLLQAVTKLNQANIFPRRYFYPALNTLPYIDKKQACPTAEDISKRILCLPIYPGLNQDVVSKICEIIKR